jgi:hypothetical protein
MRKDTLDMQRAFLEIDAFDKATFIPADVEYYSSRR